MSAPTLPTSAVPACLAAAEAFVNDVRGVVACALASQAATAASLASRTDAASIDWLRAAITLSCVQA